jgi:hypothetical protein
VKHRKDFFSKGMVIYAACFFLVYRTLFQLSYVHEHSDLSYWAVGLILFHIVGLIWCLGACLFYLMPRQFLSFICAAFLVVALEFLYPDPTKVHFWLHKREYAARVYTAQAAADGRLSIVLYRHAAYIPSMPGGSLCVTEILYDNSGDPGLISQSEDGRASFQRIDDNFYLRYPPCG